MADTPSAPALVQSIKYTRGHLSLLDQTQLPHCVAYDDVLTAEAAHAAIRGMKVRGAPAIALAALLALAVEAARDLECGGGGGGATPAEVVEAYCAKLERLEASRPTAVNLHHAVAQAKALLRRKLQQGCDSRATLEALVEQAEAMYAEDRIINQRISTFGAEHLLQVCSTAAATATTTAPLQLRVLTHCNTGALATTHLGTALGVLRELHHRHHALGRAFCTETRPYNQGARLTAWECTQEGMATTLVVDSAVAYLLQTRQVDAVIVGADRVCRNGDTANKIGTLQIAVGARHFGIPFFVAAPTTTLDLTLQSGQEIAIEQRPPTEITHSAQTGARVVVESPHLTVWNPSFDVTPGTLISGIITDLGVVTPAPAPAAAPYDLKAWLEGHSAKGEGLR